MQLLNFVSRTLAPRLFNELTHFAATTAYFYTAFVAIAFYRATVLHAYGIHAVVWGAALFNSLLIAKFLMVGQSLKIGAGHHTAPLIRPILYDVVSLFALLIILTSSEKLISGLFYHEAPAIIIHHLIGTSLGETLAEIFTLLIVLIPFVVFNVVAEALGKGRLRAMLFGNDELTA